jgi:hypothetical protein
MIAALERMSIEEIIEIRDRLKSGRTRFELVASATLSTETARWLEDVHAAMIETYDAVLARRLS